MTPKAVRTGGGSLASLDDADFSDLGGPGLRFAAKTQCVVKTYIANGKKQRKRRADNHIELARLISQHNLRRENKEHRHRRPYDKARSHLNETLIGSTTPNERAEEYAKALDAYAIIPPRVDSATMLEIVIQAEAGWDRQDFWDACLDAVKAIHPGLPILSADIHRDQDHPHMHIVLIGIRNGMLVGSRGLSDRENSFRRQWQTFMAIMRERFGLRPDRPTRKANSVQAQVAMPCQIAPNDCSASLQLQPIAGANSGGFAERTPLPIEFAGQGSCGGPATNSLAIDLQSTPSLRTGADLSDVFRKWANCSGSFAETEDDGEDAWREAFEERAAIMEFDGGLSRARAELEARRITAGKGLDGAAWDTVSRMTLPSGRPRVSTFTPVLRPSTSPRSKPRRRPGQQPTSARPTPLTTLSIDPQGASP